MCVWSQRKQTDQLGPVTGLLCSTGVSEVRFALRKVETRIVFEINSEPHGQLSKAGVPNLGSWLDPEGPRPPEWWAKLTARTACEPCKL